MHHLLGDFTMAVVAEKGDSAAAVALSALVRALYETGTCAVVRRVYAANAQVRLGCLQPHITADHEVSSVCHFLGVTLVHACHIDSTCMKCAFA